MPLSLLLALLMAFGSTEFENTSRLDPRSAADCLTWLVGSLTGFIVLAFVLGAALSRLALRGGAEVHARRMLVWVSRLLEGLSLALLGWWLFGLEWPRLVAWNFGLRHSIAVEELAILAPFLVGQAGIWAGLFPAERHVRGLERRVTFRRHMTLRARQVLGLLVPLVLVYGLGRDVLRWWFPESAEQPMLQLAGLAVVGALVLLMAPAFVRMSWPTRPLEPGVMRTRLERQAQRFGFRCTEILVWDTGGAVVNAGITGALPWFRYVLLTDALLDQLNPHEIEAVFGHEVGHVVHRHLAYFGFFFLGSIGVLSLFDTGLRWGEGSSGWWGSVFQNARLGELVEWLGAFGVLALYFFLVFGYLSRRFERQADVFGCRAVSCGDPECPPHPDPAMSSGIGAPPDVLCPVGVEIFASALNKVAELNGLAPHAPSWRHGSIARRIESLRSLSGRPEALRQFEARVAWLRTALGLALTAATALAIWVGRGVP